MAASGVDFSLLSELAPVPTRVIPAFIAPPPAVTAPELSTELAAMRTTPHQAVRAGLDMLAGPRSARLSAFYDDSDRALAYLSEVIADYWNVALAPYWPRLKTLCDGDILHRARLLADGGVARLFADLHPGVFWRDDRLLVEQRHADRTDDLRGRGLLLTPS
ncbi:MAG: ArsR family transcriptional regulator, partial [Stackebrandtia sp.]